MAAAQHAHVIVGPEGGHRLVVAGVTALERTLWGLGKRGVLTAVVAAEPFALRGDLPILVGWVPAGTPPEADVEVVRGDVVEGIHVHDAASCRAAELVLLEGLGKSYQGITDALFNRHISRRITDVLATTRVTPNQVTVVSILVGLLAAGLLLERSYWAVALGGLAIELQSILDSCDGELARLRFQYSRIGQWLDNVGDDLVDNAFIACAGLAVGGPWAWVGCGAALVRLASAVTMYLEVYQTTGTGDVYRFRIWFDRGKQTADEVFKNDPRSPFTWLRNVGRRDTYTFAWMLLCLVGAPLGVVVWGGIMAAILGVNMVIHVWLRAQGRLRPLS